MHILFEEWQARPDAVAQIEASAGDMNIQVLLRLAHQKVGKAIVRKPHGLMCLTQSRKDLVLNVRLCDPARSKLQGAVRPGDQARQE